MTHQPSFVAAILLAITSILWKLNVHPVGGKMFKLFPMPFWCYMIPMALTTFGWLPEMSPVYSFFSRQILPIAIMLLLFGTDLKALGRMGPLAGIIMLSGSLGTIIGGLGSFLIFKHWLPEGTWASVGALTGSWIGGSLNLLAVKEALQIPDRLIAPVIIMDAIIAYSWMALLIAGVNFQMHWNKIIGRSDLHFAEPMNVGFAAPIFLTEKKRFVRTAAIVFGSVCISLLAQWIAEQLPATGQIMSSATWTILLVTTAALALSSTTTAALPSTTTASLPSTTTASLSLTPLSKMGSMDTSRIGTFVLCLLLASIGARANFRMAVQTPIFFAFGLTWIFIHGACLILAGYLLKAPLKLLATASQANIGGPISAPIVGATYHPQMAGIGLLMAILGNVLGTYLGLLTATFARLLT